MQIDLRRGGWVRQTSPRIARPDARLNGRINVRYGSIAAGALEGAASNSLVLLSSPEAAVQRLS